MRDTIGRFAVWGPKDSRGKYEVLETAFTLEELKAKYGELPLTHIQVPREAE